MSSIAGRDTTPKTILVIEDDSDTREYLVMLLSFDGYRVLEAATGREALDTLGQHPIQCILLDRRMPDVDGLELCRQMRADGYLDIPIILVTADYATDIADLAQAAGVTDYLAKPFSPDVLLERLNHYMSTDAPSSHVGT